MVKNLIICELMKFYKIKSSDKELFIEEVKSQIENKEMTFNNLKALRVLGVLKDFNIKFKKNINNEYYTLFI
jgi:hypothetical protein